jgi:hypothetical protein
MTSASTKSWMALAVLGEPIVTLDGMKALDTFWIYTEISSIVVATCPLIYILSAST